MIDFCPLCRKKHEIEDCFEDYNTLLYRCADLPCKIDASVLYDTNEITKEHRLNAIYNFLYNHPFANSYKTYWRFFYEETNDPPHSPTNINVYHLMKDYPFDIEKRVNCVLLALNKLYPTLSGSFRILDLYENKPRLFYPECLSLGYEKAITEFVSLYSVLSKLNFIELRSGDDENPNEKQYALTYQALSKIKELKSDNTHTKKIFIAMAFKDEVAYIENAFKEAIANAGYTPMIIKDKEHNNYIMPEIFFEIENSAAVVVDLTSPNLGAYYEAGYALGLHKQVIACCSEKVFKSDDKPHFDIAQKSMVIWNDEKDLVEKLTKRIKYTVVTQ